MELFTGFIDAARSALGLLRRWIDLPSIDTAFICGPEPMMLTIAGSPEGPRAFGRTDESSKLFASGKQPGRAKKRVVSEAASASQFDHGGDGDPRRRHPHLPHGEDWH